MERLPEVDCELYGITTTAKPHQVAWAINQATELMLEKVDDHIVWNKRKEELSFIHYHHSTVGASIRLLQNKSRSESGSMWLIPEHPHFDFIVVVEKGDYAGNKRMQELIKTIAFVQFVAFIPLASLKIKEHFLF